jgi:hypothetical protein
VTGHAVAEARVGVILYPVMAMSREEVLSEIRTFVAKNGKIPGERTFATATRIKESAWKGKYWARWTEAVREAGYDPNTLNLKIPDERILERLGGFIAELGHFPVRDEINVQARNEPGFPVWQTIRKRYGGMPQTAQALLDFSRKSGNTTLGKLCQERLEIETLKPTPSANLRRKAPVRVGFVYLKYSPSLRLYKIGKADDPHKRGVGLSLLLPEDLVAKHEIRTDYPYILEKYWEARFRAKKKQGEWYDLSSEEVEAFKKRREFMFEEFL